MRKAELEAHNSAFVASEGDIQRHVDLRDFEAAFSACESSLICLPATIKYRKQQGISPEVPPIFALETACKYAPPLFEHATLFRIKGFFQSNRVLAKHDNDYLGALDDAIDRVEVARRIWTNLERAGWVPMCDCLQDHASEEAVVQETIDVWRELKLVAIRDHDSTLSVALLARHELIIDGLCPACGVQGRAKKERFYAPATCKRCGYHGFFHMLDYHLTSATIY